MCVCVCECVCMTMLKFTYNTGRIDLYSYSALWIIMYNNLVRDSFADENHFGSFMW